MVSLRRELVYSLLIAICLLIVGLIALLWVANTREHHYQDELSDLRRVMAAQKAEIQALHQRLESNGSTADSTWNDWPADTTLSVR